MNKIIKNLAYMAVAALGLVSCKSEDVTYEGPKFVMFADTTITMPVFSDDPVYDLYVVTTQTSSVDRNYAVDVMSDGSSAIRGYHYDFVDGSNNITIKAGENKAPVKIKSYYDNISFQDSLVLKLELVAPKDEYIDCYSTHTAIEFTKIAPFDINTFVKENGEHARMTATWPLSTTATRYYRQSLIRANDRFVIKNMINPGFDIIAHFDNSDPANPKMKVPEQRMFIDGNYGEVYCRTVNSFPSYFVAHEHYFVLYLEVYVPQIGSFGVYSYTIESITEDVYMNNVNGIIK